MNTDLIAAVETSCDETSVALYHMEDGLLASELYSQIDLHKNVGGVIPEVASREQLEKIEPVFMAALEKAGKIITDIDVIAVTNRPGLPGSLLVGLCFSKAIALAVGAKLIGIDHLEGHAFSPFLEHKVPFPHLCITASGGHTSLYLMHDFGKYEILGTTLDDAAGEAFDKIAKLMDLPYPGGPTLEKLAAEVDFADTRHYPRSKHKTLNFSFSGLKTAVLYDLVEQDAYNLENKTFLKQNDHVLKCQVAASLHVCVADIFIQKLTLGLALYPQVRAITFAGGVACNIYIAQRLREFAHKHRLEFYKPSAQFCTDNAAMIAFVAQYRTQQHLFHSLELDIFQDQLSFVKNI